MTVNYVIPLAVARLEAWLETMRGPGGYTGPVAHWWQNCLFYTGPGLDWRYEGIIFGYLTLYERTGDPQWLDKARRAGSDLLEGQLPSGHFAGSCFELNPYTAGTPHEAACDLALLTLAQTLRLHEDEEWHRFHAAAERNLREAQLGRLWDASARVLRDDPHTPSFVPNKAATLVEAILALARTSPDGTELIERYGVPILDRILELQIQRGQLRGGIWQNTYGTQCVTKLFPYYVARCVPGLVEGYVATGDERYLVGAIEAIDFVLRVRDDDGGFPQVIYSNGSVHAFPRWIAGAADVLRAIAVVRERGYPASFEPTLSWLLSAQHPSGAFPTADGFAAQGTGNWLVDAPTLRDLLPVVGWNDKVFRFLTTLLPGGARLPSVASEPYETACAIGGRTGVWSETPYALELRSDRGVVYRWDKGARWASVTEPEVAWK